MAQSPFFSAWCLLPQYPQQRNGAVQSDSDSTSTAFFHRAVLVATAAPLNAPAPCDCGAFESSARWKTRNADHANRLRKRAPCARTRLPVFAPVRAGSRRFAPVCAGSCHLPLLQRRTH